MVFKVRESAYSSLMVSPGSDITEKEVCDDKKNKKSGRRGHIDREVKIDAIKRYMSSPTAD